MNEHDFKANQFWFRFKPYNLKIPPETRNPFSALMCVYVCSSCSCVSEQDARRRSSWDVIYFLSIKRFMSLIIKWFMGLSSWVLHQICFRLLDLSIMCVCLFLNIWRFVGLNIITKKVCVCVCAFSFGRIRWPKNSCLVEKFMFDLKPTLTNHMYVFWTW